MSRRTRDYLLRNFVQLARSSETIFWRKSEVCRVENPIRLNRRFVDFFFLASKLGGETLLRGFDKLHFFFFFFLRPPLNEGAILRTYRYHTEEKVLLWPAKNHLLSPLNFFVSSQKKFCWQKENKTFSFWQNKNISIGLANFFFFFAIMEVPNFAQHLRMFSFSSLNRLKRQTGVEPPIIN